VKKPTPTNLFISKIIARVPIPPVASFLLGKGKERIHEYTPGEKRFLEVATAD
jgi:hypothetical protein